MLDVLENNYVFKCAAIRLKLTQRTDRYRDGYLTLSVVTWGFADGTLTLFSSQGQIRTISELDARNVDTVSAFTTRSLYIRFSFPIFLIYH